MELLKPLKESGIPDVSTYEAENVEAYIMGCARRSELSVHLDHSVNTVTFIDDPFVSTDDPSSYTSRMRETPIQPSTADLVRTRLSSLALCLHHSLSAIHQDAEELLEQEQQVKFSQLAAAANAEREELRHRRALVARRRELLSELSQKKEKEEISRRAELAKKQKEEDERRLIEERRRREVENARKEIENIRSEEAKKFAQSLKEKGNIKVDINVCMSECTSIPFTLWLKTLRSSFRLSEMSAPTLSCECTLSNWRRISENWLGGCASLASGWTTLSGHTGKRSDRSLPRTMKYNGRTIV
jgi:translation initiation factor 3 subunit A